MESSELTMIDHLKGIAFYAGLVWVAAGGLAAGVLMPLWVMGHILNRLGRRFKSLWIIVEYALYRKEFKEWLKDKPRIKK